MKKIINKTFHIFNVSSFLFLVIGIILAVFPEITLSIISYSIAALLIVTGISLVSEKTKTVQYGTLSAGTFALILGFIILIFPKILTNIIPIILSIIIILNGASKLSIAIAIKNENGHNWLLIMIIAIINILCGILLLLNPSFGANTITSIIGFILIIYSVSNIIDLLIIKKQVKDITKIFHK